MKNLFIFILLSFPRHFVLAQQIIDSIDVRSSDLNQATLSLSSNALKFSFRQLIIPTALIGYGVIALSNEDLKSFNLNIRDNITEDNHRKLALDNITQFVPMASVYALNFLGNKGKHNFKDRTIIMGTAYMLMGSTVFGLKNWTGVERPDGSAHSSFPSGHTANAFMGAEFLFQEYKDVAPWYGIVGYLVASGTGYLRMYNNRHWFSDVAAGAGIGILSTKVAYWIHPWMKEKIFKDKGEKYSFMALPMYDGKHAGLAFALYY